jgi:hypothetical protein
MNRSSIEQVVTLVIMLPLPFIVIWTAVMSHLLSGQLQQLFKCSPILLCNRNTYARLGILGEIIICGHVCLICLIPRLYIWRGVALRSEIEAMPKKLKLRLYPPFIASFLWCSALLISGLFFE